MATGHDRPHLARSISLGLGALACAAAFLLSAAPATADFGFQPGATGFDGEVLNADGSTATQAGSHPFDASTSFMLNTTTDAEGNLVPDGGNLKDLAVSLPPGLVGNPQVLGECPQDVFNQVSGNINGGPPCPDSSAAGVMEITIGVGGPDPFTFTVPIYNLTPRLGIAAEFGTALIGVPIRLNASVRSGDDYGLDIASLNISQSLQVVGAKVALWGVPADPSHDGERGACLTLFGPSGDTCPAGLPPRPFLTLPTSCLGPQTTTIKADSWSDPGNFATTSFVSHDNATPPNPVGATGCAQLDFSPQVAVQPDTAAADSPSGLGVSLQVPQNDLPDGLAEAHLKRAVVNLPAGMTVNPSAADGLAGCSEAQIALSSADPANCPDASKVGSVEITTPLLDHTIEGGVFLATQGTNPFNNLLALYIAAYDPLTGVVIKLPGKVDPDPDSGQLRATFDNNPQLPFSEFELHFKGGARGVLVTPPTCGIYETTSELSPWSAADPENPTPDEVVTDTSTFVVDQGPGGGPCLAGDPSQPGDPADRADLPFSPGFSAGLVHPIAGQSSPFVLRATREDGHQEITKIAADLPPGLLAKLAGIPQCSDAVINSIPTALGTGQAEKANPSCPAGSQFGHVSVGTGAGPTPFYIPGQVYLGGPYHGAPLSLAIVTPAVAGPFDLGNVVVRSKLEVDTDDAQVHVESDHLPTILEGIPLHIRDIRVIMDRPGFMQAPTNCNPLAVTGTISGAGASLTDPGDDTAAGVQDRFQVAGCGALGFSPDMDIALLGGKDETKRSQHPTLLFNLKGTLGDANLAAVSVLLPSAFQIDQSNLGNICSEAELAASRCAGRNTIGSAVAKTPLLDVPLQGPVYAVSGSGGLPRLAVILRGPASMPIELIVRGDTTTEEGARIRNTFATVPDAAVSDFALTINGGDGGYLVNNRNICRKPKGLKKKQKRKLKKMRASAKRLPGKAKKGKLRKVRRMRRKMLRSNVTFDISYFGQNGDTLDQEKSLDGGCDKKGKKKGKGKSGKKHR